MPLSTFPVNSASVPADPGFAVFNYPIGQLLLGIIFCLTSIILLRSGHKLLKPVGFVLVVVGACLIGVGLHVFTG
jgi:hypothetical protein